MRARTAIAVVLTGAMSVFGVGCTGEPPSAHQQEQQGVLIGNFIFFTIYMAMCQANGGECPFPIAPSLPTQVES